MVTPIFDQLVAEFQQRADSVPGEQRETPATEGEAAENR
jgi:hypothetical protein